MPDQPDNYTLGRGTIHFRGMEFEADGIEVGMDRGSPEGDRTRFTHGGPVTGPTSMAEGGRITNDLIPNGGLLSRDQSDRFVSLLSDELSPPNHSLLDEITSRMSERMAQDMDDMVLNGLRGAEAGERLRGRMNYTTMIDDAWKKEEEKTEPPKPKFRHIRL